MKTKNIFYKNLYFNIGVLPVLFIFLLAFTAFYAHPNGEDLYKANMANAGIINAAIDQYLIYDGRYTTNLLHGFIPPVWGSPSQQYVSALFFLFSFILASFYFFSSFLKLFNLYKRKIAFITAIIFTATYTAVIPELKYFMFLCPGGIVYGISASIFLFLSGTLFLLIEELNNTKRLLLLILAFELEIMSIGMNEMNMVFNNMMFFSFLVFVLFFKKKKHLIIEGTILFIISISFSIISISSPGIGLDRDMSFNALIDLNKILISLFISLKYSSHFIIHWIANTPLLFIFPFMIYILIVRKINLKLLLIAPLVFIPISLFIITLTNLTYILPFHDTITIYNFPTRIQNTAQLFTILISTFIIFIIGSIQTKHRFIDKTVQISNTTTHIYIPLIFAVLFFFHSTPISLIQDWTSGRIVNYNNKMDHRYETLIQGKAANKKFVYLETIKDLPYSITDNVKLSPNFEDILWLKSYEKYYGIKIIMKE